MNSKLINQIRALNLPAADLPGHVDCLVGSLSRVEYRKLRRSVGVIKLSDISKEPVSNGCLWLVRSRQAVMAVADKLILAAA